MNKIAKIMLGLLLSTILVMTIIGCENGSSENDSDENGGGENNTPSKHADLIGVWASEDGTQRLDIKADTLSIVTADTTWEYSITTSLVNGLIITLTLKDKDDAPSIIKGRLSATGNSFVIEDGGKTYTKLDESDTSDTSLGYADLIGVWASEDDTVKLDIVDKSFTKTTDDTTTVYSITTNTVNGLTIILTLQDEDSNPSIMKVVMHADKKSFVHTEGSGDSIVKIKYKKQEEK